MKLYNIDYGKAARIPSTPHKKPKKAKFLLALARMGTLRPRVKEAWLHPHDRGNGKALKGRAHPHIYESLLLS